MKTQTGPFKNNIIITLDKKEAERVKEFLTSSLNYHSAYGAKCPFMDNLTNKLRDLIKKTWG